MRYFYSILFCLLLLSKSINAQECLGGGCNNLIKNYPTSTLAATTTWGIVNTTQGAFINGGNYAFYNLTAGYTYYWSTCQSFGGNTGFDAELTLFDCSGKQICYSNDYCGTGPYLKYFATSSCTVKVLVSAFNNGSYCQSNGPSAPYCTLMWMRSSTICNAVTNGSTQPQSQTVSAGSTATFNVSVNGTPPFSYFWYKNGAFIKNTLNTNSTSDSYTTPILGSNDNNSNYYCLLQNCINSYQVQSNTATLTVNSSSTNGSVNVTLNPTGAVSAGAQWKLDSGINQNSGVTLSNASVGTHTINFNSISGWTSPLSQTINVTNGNTTFVTGTYTQITSQYGSVNVTLSPAGAISAGAQWNLDGGTYQNSGVTLSNVLIGTHTINYKSILGWTSPSSQAINIANGATTTVTGTYTQSSSQSGSVNVTLSPTGAVNAGAQWNLDGGNYQNTGITLSNVSVGSHTINYKSISGWTAPLSQTINVTNGNITYVTGTYTQSISLPTINSITFTNVIENHQGIDRLYTLYSGAPTATNNPIKICADGSISTYFKINISNTSNITFKILDENGSIVIDAQGSTNTAKYGQLGKPYSVGSNEIEVAFTHPQYMDLNKVSRSCTLQIMYGNTVLNTFPLQIYRAPIVFVHGLYGDKGTFKICADYLISNNQYPPFQQSYNPLLQLVDYINTNGYSFKSNRRIIKSNIDIAFLNARQQNFSCGKVVLIGHSMGGVLSRLYLQSSWADVQYRFDIHKLITVNTPHFGTQLANLITALNDGTNSLSGYIIKGIVLGYFNMNGTDAINDLRVNSKEVTEYLNVPIYYQNLVPSHTISTTKLASNVSSNASTMEKMAKFISNIPNLFNGESNDLVVPLSSQKANFNWGKSSDDQFHIGSTANPIIKSEILDLINSDPLDYTKFSWTGFTPGHLTSNYKYYNEKNLNQTQINGDSIYFTNPLHNQTFNYGDSIVIGIHGSKDINRLFYIENIQDSSSLIIDTSLNSILTKIKLKSNQVGRVVMGVLGSTITGITSADTTSIYINPLLGLIKLDVQPKLLKISLGQKELVNINGIYSNNNILNLNGINNILVALDTTRITYMGNGILYAKGAIDSTIIFSYEGKSDTIRILVTNSADNNVSSFNYNKYKICSGNVISFYDDSRGLSTMRKWFFPGGSPSLSSSLNPVVTYNTPGKYKVSLITTFENGIDSLSIDSLIEINNNPIPSIIGTSSICSGTSTTLDAGSGYANYLWSTGATTQTIKDSIPGTVSVSVFDNNGCTGSSTFNLVVKPLLTPTIKISPAQTTSICSGQTLTFTATTVNEGSIPVFTWYLNGQAKQSGSSPTFTTPILNANTQVYCDLNSNADCTTLPTVYSSTTLINVNPIIVPAVSISSTANLICAGKTVIFTAIPINGGNSPTYLWYVNGVQSQSGKSATFTTPALNANSQVYCVMNSNADCVAQQSANSSTIEITVSPIVIPNINITATTSTDICSGKTVTFVSSVTNAGTSSTYQWYLNGLPAGSNNSTFTTIPLNTNSQVYCTITSNAVCGVSKTSNTINISITQTVTPAITISQLSCVGSTLIFNSTIKNGGPAPLYLWTVNGSATGNYSDSIFTLNNSTNGKKVQCTLTSNATCITQFRVTSLPINIDCVLNPVKNIDGVEGFLIVPNPTSTGNFNIEIKLTKKKNVSFVFLNNMGQIFYSLPAKSINGVQTIPVSIGHRSAGTYYVKTIVNTESFTTKFEIIN